MRNTRYNFLLDSLVLTRAVIISMSNHFLISRKIMSQRRTGSQKNKKRGLVRHNQIKIRMYRSS